MQTPNLVTVAKMFQGETRYRAPVYQRFYEWGSAELDKMIDDINDASSSRPEFLGAIVIQDVGRLGGPGSPTEYLMVDGQQRLTTLFLLICGMAWLDLNYGKGEEANHLVTTYLTRGPGTYAGWPNLVPTVQDRRALWRILNEDISIGNWNFQSDPQDDTHRKKIEQQWVKIKKYLEVAILNKANKIRAKAFQTFLGNLLDGLQTVTITLDKEEDANIIFSKLNARGQPLHLSDLVRNDVFSRFGSEQAQNAEKFYSDKWLPFEKCFSGGSFDQYFPIFAYIKSKGRVTKAEAYPYLQKTWNQKTPLYILRDLSAYSIFYRALTDYEEIESLASSVRLYVERLSRMPRTTVTWPFILKVLSECSLENLTSTRAKACLSIVESFLVRRAIVGWEPTGLHAVFKSLWEKTKGDPKLVRKNLFTRTVKCPTDSDIRKTLEEEASDTRSILKYVLQEYEISLASGKGFDIVPHDTVTIEHVLPKNLSKTWLNEFTKSEHRHYVGLIGNLVALSGFQNKSIKDAAWEKKRERYKGSNWKSTQELANKKRWGKATINRRNKVIIDWIVDRWPYPGL